MATQNRKKWRSWTINKNTTFAGTVSLGSTLAVTGALTLSSTLAVTGAAQFDGAVTLGNAAADVITITGQVAGSIEFQGAAQHNLIGEADQVLAVKSAGTGHLYLGTAGDENAIEIEDVSGDVTVANALAASSTLNVTGKITGSAALDLTGDLTVLGASGALCALKTKTVLMDLSSSLDATDFIPAGAVVVGLVARVTTEITGDSTFAGTATWLLGHSGDTDEWGAGLAAAADTTVDPEDWTAGTVAGIVYASATTVSVAATAGTISAGGVRLVLYYWDITAPTA